MTSVKRQIKAYNYLKSKQQQRNNQMSIELVVIKDLDDEQIDMISGIVPCLGSNDPRTIVVSAEIWIEVTEHEYDEDYNVEYVSI